MSVGSTQDISRFSVILQLNKDFIDCSPGPTNLNSSQVVILAHKHWVGVCFFLFWLYVSFSHNNPDKQSICLWPPPWITITHDVVEAEHVGKVQAPDVTAHLFQCSHHYRITDLQLRLSTSFQVVSKTDPIKNWDILGCSSTWFNRYPVSLHREKQKPWIKSQLSANQTVQMLRSLGCTVHRGIKMDTICSVPYLADNWRPHHHLQEKGPCHLLQRHWHSFPGIFLGLGIFNSSLPSGTN